MDFHIERVGIGNLLFETDFPHNTDIYNDRFEDTLAIALGKQSEDVRREILWENPAKVYGSALEAQGVATTA